MTQYGETSNNKTTRCNLLETSNRRTLKKNWNPLNSVSDKSLQIVEGTVLYLNKSGLSTFSRNLSQTSKAQPEIVIDGYT